MRLQRLIGSETTKLSLDIVIILLAPVALCAAPTNALRTESSSPKSRNAATTEIIVKTVRVLRLKSADQTRCRYFTRQPPAPPRKPRPACLCRGAEYGSH